MSLSLREQLLQAGLVSKKQVKQAEQQQYQSPRKNKNKPAKLDERAAALQQAQAAKAARDQELNRKQQEKAERKARLAQAKQLIEQNRLPKLETDEYFNFTDGRKIRRMAVDAPRREQLIRGELMIVRCEGRYDVVPAEAAARIREREERCVIALNANPPAATAGAAVQDDPYKDFVVPDDLMW